MTNQELSLKILELVGGKDNVASATNCMTRLRVTLKDRAKADIDGLTNTEGVLGVVQDAAIQVILGPGKAKKVTDQFKIDAGLDSPGASADKIWEETGAVRLDQTENRLSGSLRLISDIFTPLIPAIIAAGLFNGIASVLSQIPYTQAAIATGTGFWFLLSSLCSLFGDAFLGYFAIYTGLRSAEVFGATPALGGMIGAASIGAQIDSISTALGLFNTEIPLDSILTTDKGGIIGVIVGVWLLSIVEKNIRNVVPDVLDLILTPLLSMLITGGIYVIILLPVTGYISDSLVWILSSLVESGSYWVRIVSGFVMAALFLPMVLLGLHHGLIPIYSIQLEQMGGVSLYPCLAMAGAGQVGASLAIYVKARKVRNLRMQKTVLGALPAGVLGIGEPLIYGVTLPMGKPFITAGLGAGFGGAFCMLMGVQSIAWGPSGIVATALMKTPAMMLYFVMGLVISYVMGFLITWFGIPEQDVIDA